MKNKKKDEIVDIDYWDYSKDTYCKGFAVGIRYKSGKCEVLHFNDSWKHNNDFMETIDYFDSCKQWKRVKL